AARRGRRRLGGTRRVRILPCERTAAPDDRTRLAHSLRDLPRRADRSSAVAPLNSLAFVDVDSSPFAPCRRTEIRNNGFEEQRSANEWRTTTNGSPPVSPARKRRLRDRRRRGPR